MAQSLEWKNWINARFTEWRGNSRGKGSGITGFARFIGVDHQVVTAWMDDGVIPNRKSTISALLSKYPTDPDLYTLLDVTPPPTSPPDPLASLPPIHRELITSISQALQTSDPSDTEDEVTEFIIAFLRSKGATKITDSSNP